MRKSSNKKVKPEIIELNNLEVKVLSNDKHPLETSQWIYIFFYLTIFKLADESNFQNRSAQLCLRFVPFSAGLEKGKARDHG